MNTDQAIAARLLLALDVCEALEQSDDSCASDGGGQAPQTGVEEEHRIANRVRVDKRYCWTEESTWGDAYVIGLDIAEGDVSTDDPNRPSDFPSSFEVVPVVAASGAPCNEKREHRIVGLRGAAEVAIFRKLRWTARATVAQPASKTPMLAEPKPPAPTPTADMEVTIARFGKTVRSQHPC